MQTILDGRAAAERAVLALGMFDGVHIGHRVLLERARSLARRRRAPLIACTFVSHPMTLIAPEKCPPMLTTFDERARLLEGLGVDMLFALPFDQRMMNMPPENYVGELVRRFHPTDVVCGYNHSYGRAGRGTPALLAALGGALGFQTSVVPRITLDGREVSSTAIRALLGEGEAARARELLGRPYSRCAVVADRHHGHGELVMTPNGKQDVPAGCYRALWDDGGRAYPLLLRVEREGHAGFYLPEKVEMRSDGTLRFIARVAEKA